MQKLLSIISIAFAATVMTIPVLAEPSSFRGSKGTYTVDFQKGTYRGCLFSGGCITLGRKQMVSCKGDGDQCEVTRWKRGEYEYAVFDGNIWVRKNDRTIFQDSQSQ